MPSMSDPRRLNQGSSDRTTCIELPLAICGIGMDIIGPNEPSASNGHQFILVAIDHFTKWVEATSHKSVTKKVLTDFVKNNLICCFGMPESIITDNGANLNSHLMKNVCEQFKITQRNSTAYRPQMNGAMDVANKNIKRALRKMIDNYKNCTAKHYALLGSGDSFTEDHQEAKLNDAEWVRNRYEQLAMIDEKRMVEMCHGQLYRQRMSRAFNKRVRARLFQIRQLVLKRVFPDQEDYKGKFAPNWKGPYMVRKILSVGAVVLAQMDGQEWPKAINTDALRRYYT
ncbi:uncharacterized protein LOC132045578 [Lycium ferocissimum]|uniref:uncharacterized protein LOC132045578 n=1 Tax=Lycium ferocissimum TaxID=112874 RepID=UPI0028149957|nr:uncharacterized protein LOC132045578 [Lycium ferocissimum]